MIDHYRVEIFWDDYSAAMERQVNTGQTTFFGKIALPVSID